MMPLNEMVLAVSSSLPASIVIKGTAVTATALICAGLGRRCRASVRHVWLASAAGVLLLLPVAAVVERPVSIAVTTDASRVQAPVVPTSDVSVSPAAVPGDFRLETPTTGSTPVALSTWLFAGWAVGTVLFLIPIALGLRQLRGLRRTSVPWDDGQAVADAIARNSGIDRRVGVVLHETVRGPMTCGVTRPVIFLPADAPEWNAEELNRAIVHELEHVRRGDWISHCATRLVCALYWFHPLVWALSRRLALEAERACDDAVLRESDAPAYADQLVSLAQRLSAARNSPAIAMASRADLKARVSALLDTGQQRGRIGAFSVALTFAAAVILVFTLSPLTMVAAPQDAVSPTPAALSPAAPILVAQGAQQAPPSASPRSQTRPAQASPAVSTAAGPISSWPTFTSSTIMVKVDLTAKDQNGKVVEGLKADDFTLTEDGKPQRIMVLEFQSLNDGGLSSYYVLGYYSTNGKTDGAYRKINVALNNSTAKLDYRAGYYGEKAFDNFTPADQVAPSPNLTSVGPATNLPFGMTPAMSGKVANLPPGARPPTVLTRVDPAYSEEARKAKYSGTVTLQLEVSVNGQATNVRVARPLGMGLDEQAVAAVQRWRFTPAQQDGQPIAATVQVVMSFRLM